ncbi:cellulose biosynthesis protein BcsQ [Halopolyspora algeriensis]|uniref:Cellulose biosynthesis protein BcsQ n=1 Tax=Halopolyspora algeriensis TaxID=1500506 RepID=A0A368VS41_9ACTN|nr:ParA family protein [Halopolyspora algeriensis]RCW43287.1 cellulose biosynthesis protein BcsQ [Halopolyspora algeriensis]TQM56346.1 cellulose biosynthesis protein BcsQ [Halopolyspora algeriensis]
MHTVAVLSLKGGVGKTTVALGLASAAMRRGVRTLVVDLDPQCNATASLEPEETRKGLSDVLADPREDVLRAAVAPSAWGEEVDVLVGSEDAEVHNGHESGDRYLARLTDALSRLDDMVAEGELPYQLVLLDCPPSLGRLTRSALVAADRALLVTEPTIFAVSGVQRAFEAVQAERAENNPQLQPLGVVVNRVRPRSHEHQFRIEELREIFGPLVMPVTLPDRLAVQQAQGACLPIHQWGTPGAREVALAFNLLLARALRAGRSRRAVADGEAIDEDAADGESDGQV